MVGCSTVGRAVGGGGEREGGTQKTLNQKQTEEKKVKATSLRFEGSDEDARGREREREHFRRGITLMSGQVHVSHLIAASGAWRLAVRVFGTVRRKCGHDDECFFLCFLTRAPEPSELTMES